MNGDKISLQNTSLKLYGENNRVKKNAGFGLLEFYFQTKGIYYV